MHPIDGGRGRRRALVTGGAVRVGRVIALALADAGYDVTIHYHRSERDAERTVRELRDRGCNASAARADLTQPDEVRALLAPDSGHVSDLAILVNSAACFPRGAPETVTVDDWDRVFSLNIRAPFLCAQAAFGLLRERGGAESRAPLGHIGDPADVVGAVVFLAEAQFITGEVLRVDGGTHLRRVY